MSFLLRTMAGPLYQIHRHWSYSFRVLFLVLLLTVITQVGGIILWLSLPALSSIRIRVEAASGRTIALGVATAIFITIYGFFSWFIVPNIAPIFGRVALPCFSTDDLAIKPGNILFCALNRNYVVPGLKDLLIGLSKNMANKHEGFAIMYLDANLPFIDGFPLIPHLSHNDGRKVDLAFPYWVKKSHASFDDIASPIGYWAFEFPRDNEKDACHGSGGLLRWNFRWLQGLFDEVEIDPAKTREILTWLTSGRDSNHVRKLFIEPHLKQRLGVNSGKIRFQGCHAARHDDHIHVEYQ